MTKKEKIEALINQGHDTKKIAKVAKVSAAYVYALRNKMKKAKPVKFMKPAPELVQPKTDTVNHPPHYNTGKIEVIDFIEDQKLSYHLGNVVKYVCRADHKGSRLEDLKKALWYLNRAIERDNQ